MKKRIISVLLIFCLLYAPLLSVRSSASGELFLSDAELTRRMDTLYELLGDTYFNTTQGTSCGRKSRDHGCRYCLTNNIVESDWFIALFGEVSVSQFPTTYTYSGHFGGAAYSCAGFATFAEWYIFKEKTSDRVETERIGRYMFTSENVNENAQIGDLIRLNGVGHSFIIYSIQEDGVTILDCNWSAEYNCLVQKHTLEYDRYSGNSFTISRVPHTSISALTVSYNANGGTIDSVPAGKMYRVTAQTGLNMRKGPGLSYDIIKSLPCGTEFEVYGNEEPVSADGYGWVPSTVESDEGWLAVSKANLAILIGETRSAPYYVEDGYIFTSAGASKYTQILNYGETYEAGLITAEELGLYNGNRTFLGWSADPESGEVLSPGVPLSADTVSGNADNGSGSVTLYAMWTTEYGDCNGDGVIDGRDLIRLRKYIDNYDDVVGLSSVFISPMADCNGDGTIDGRDLIRLRKYIVEYDDETGTSPIPLGPEEPSDQ